jgi:hypothetical protein
MKRVLLTGLVLVMLLAGGIAPTVAQDEPSIEGTWLTNGYGLAIEVTPDTIYVYEVTAVSCMTFLELPNTEEALAEAGLLLTLEDDQLVIRDPMTMHTTAHRVDALPTVCDNGGTPETDDPELNFEIVWNAFNEQYAFFDLYGVDWQAQYDTYRPQVTADTTPEQLFEILSQMLEPLDDGHISLYSDTSEFSPAPLPEWFVGNEDTIITYIIDHYFASEDLTQLANGLIVYKWLNDTVGYIGIAQMAGYGATDAEELANAAAAIDQVIAEFANAETIIVDVRFNGGGYDGIALTLAGRFTDQEYLAFTKQSRDGDSFTPIDSFYVTPSGIQQYTGNVIVLTSLATASAAEIFIMAMQTLPNVTVIGEPTSGGFSDILDFHLPNGWQFGLSNQVYYASDGQVYESIGMQPDVVIPFDAEHFLAGQDDTLNAALES